MVYQKGDLHKDVDCLSRAPVDTSDRYLEDRIFTVVSPSDPDDSKESYNDEESGIFLEKARLRHDNFELRNGVVYWKKRLYVPKDKRAGLLARAHSSEVAGHGDIRKSVADCVQCQMRKIERATPAGTMKSFSVFENNHTLAVDYLGPITQTLKFNKYVIISIDCFSRFIFAKPAAETTSETFVDFLVDYCSIFGVPKNILTDNAKTFTSQAVKKVTKMFGIEHRFSTPMHSQGNAIAERAIQSMQERLN